MPITFIRVTERGTFIQVTERDVPAAGYQKTAIRYCVRCGPAADAVERLGGRPSGLPPFCRFPPEAIQEADIFSRWVGIVALIGGVAFIVAFLAVIDGLGEDSLFGFGFFPGVPALVIWSIGTSIAQCRALVARVP